MKAEVSTVGIIGGGQLGMFLAQACQEIGLITHIYSDTDDAPAKKYANKIIYGSFNDHKKLNEFRKNVDLLTYEFENVAIKTLKQINKQISKLCFTCLRLASTTSSSATRRRRKVRKQS